VGCKPGASTLRHCPARAAFAIGLHDQACHAEHPPPRGGFPTAGSLVVLSFASVSMGTRVDRVLSKDRSRPIQSAVHTGLHMLCINHRLDCLRQVAGRCNRPQPAKIRFSFDRQPDFGSRSSPRASEADWKRSNPPPSFGWDVAGNLWLLGMRFPALIVNKVVMWLCRLCALYLACMVLLSPGVQAQRSECGRLASLLSAPASTWVLVNCKTSREPHNAHFPC